MIDTIRVRVFAAGLLASLAALVDSPAIAAEAVDVRCRHDVVQVDAADADTQAIVEAIAAACGLRYIGHAPVDGTTTLVTDDVSLSEVLERLLTDDSYQLLLAEPAGSGPRGTLWVFADGETLPAEAAILFETAMLQGTVAQRRQAVRDLRRHGSDDAVNLLALALVDPDRRIRDAAMEALAAIGSDAAVAALASAGSSLSAPDRAEAADMLAMTDAPLAIDYLEVALRDPDPAVRAAVLESLADVPDERGLPLVRAALEDPSVEVRQAALEVLEALDDERQFRALYPWK